MIMMSIGEKSWHTMSQEELFQELNLSNNICEIGLSQWEVSKRRVVQKHIKNLLLLLKKLSTIIGSNFIFTIILGSIGLLSLYEAITNNDWNYGIEVIIITLIFLINLIIHSLKYRKGEKESSNNNNHNTITVIRDGGSRKKCLVRNLVLGDVVVLQDKDEVPCDLRVIQTNGLITNQQALTGKANRSIKTVEANDTIEYPISSNMCYKGTIVIGGGEGIGIVVGGIDGNTSSSSDTVFGVKRKQQFLATKQMNNASLWTGCLVILSTVGTFCASYFHTEKEEERVDWYESLLIALVCAVGMIPVGIDTIIAITYGWASWRALQRRKVFTLPSAFDTLGCCTVVCTDINETLKPELTTRTFNMGVRIILITKKDEVSALDYAIDKGLVSSSTKEDGESVVLQPRVFGKKKKKKKKNDDSDEESLAQQVITGSMIDSMDDNELANLLLSKDVYAECSAEHKLRIIKILQAQGNICAVAGTTTEDIQALKIANIGICMNQGNGWSRDQSDIILEDDNFESIISSFEDGHLVWDNLRKGLHINIPINVAQGWCILFGLLFGLPELPLTAIQILYCNFVCTVTLGCIAASEPYEKGILHPTPRDQYKKLIGRYFFLRITIASIALISSTIGSVFWARHLYVVDGTDYNNDVLPLLRSQASNTLTFGACAIAMSCRLANHTALGMNSFNGNNFVWYCLFIVTASQVCITYIPGLNRKVFDMGPMEAEQWGIVAIFAIGIFVLMELEKKLRTHYLSFQDGSSEFGQVFDGTFTSNTR